MTEICLINTGVLKELDLSTISDILSPYRKEKLDSIRLQTGKALSLAAELALISAFYRFMERRMYRYYDPSEIDYEKINPVIAKGLTLPLNIRAGENGKPVFIENDDIYGNSSASLMPSKNFFVSVSHSGDYACACVSDTNCGLDIEQVRDKEIRNPEKILHENEFAVYEEISDENEKKNYFYERWVLKESYIKNTGDGLGIWPPKLDASSGVPSPLKSPKCFWLLNDSAPSGYKLALCCDGSGGGGALNSMPQGNASENNDTTFGEPQKSVTVRDVSAEFIKELLEIRIN